ncbi:DUF1062 domain-containing protein [Xylanimonas protaetiae]|uniref:DUF1062 domain-containing protein n=1 Tax=Xylanimonas protaetiae TaxID=2509457 RepID=A0A4P6F4C2_9MICO|nr:DUF1062 domain-containing protein [Xylanimonas protaetiae]QAY69543.1 DUF1062 domain-containing protein [Xylanimonas protaetiae]
MHTTWVVVPTCLPSIVRRCHVCSSDRFQTDGAFRVNAHHKILDVWLLALCTTCEETTKITVLERVNVRYVDPDLLDRFHENDVALAATLLQDPAVQHRNRFTLDWGEGWRLETGGWEHPDEGAIDVSVRFAARVPVRPVRLVAEGLGLTRGSVERLIADGSLVSAHRLTGRRSSDFTFTLKRG